MDQLIVFARRFKGFLAFAALIFLGLIFLVSFLFSKGSFDQILSGFNGLSPNQFLSIVYTVLGLPFIIIVLLIILSYRSTLHDGQQKIQSGLLYIIVHDIEDKTKGIADAEVRLTLPEPRVSRTDSNGGTKFAFPAEFTGQSYLINASKAGYQSGKPQQVKMEHGSTITIGLKRNVQKPSRRDNRTNVTERAVTSKDDSDTPNESIIIQRPERKTRMVIGLAIDLSGSMSESILNNSGGQLSRLQGFQRSMDRLVQEARKTVREGQDKNINTSIDIFAYGFGLRGLSVCDLLSLIKVGHNIITEQEIENLKQQYINEISGQYSRYDGLADIARQSGFGGLVRDIERSVKATAEADIRRRILIEIKRRLEVELAKAGDTTLPVEEVARLWNNSNESFNNAEELIYGSTPMKQAMGEITARFKREMDRIKGEIDHSSDNTSFVLFVLSDGAPTDGSPLESVAELKSIGITIVSCYITNQDISDPRTLVSESEPQWKEEAKLMLNMASEIQEQSEFAQFLIRKGWTVDPGSKLFVQLNHSEILEEFISVVLSPLSNPDPHSFLPRGE